MTRNTITTMCVFTVLMFAGSARASLIGDTVSVNLAPLSVFPVVPAVTVITPGIELGGASLSTFGFPSPFPLWDINIESNFIVIDFLVTTHYGAGFSFTFSDLDWVGPPGPGIVTGVAATTNQNVIPISATFTADSVRVEFGSNIAANWQQGDQIRLDLQTAHIPEPVSFTLLGLGGLSLIRRHRIHS